MTTDLIHRTGIAAPETVAEVHGKRNELMKLTKSSRHSKITGDFGEAIVLYLLSRHGFRMRPC